MIGIFRWLEAHFEEYACMALIALMGSLIFLQVVMRYIFSFPLAWTDEIAVYCMVWSVYLGGALAVRERAHIRVMNGILALGGKLSIVLIVISDSIWLGINVLLIWQTLILQHSFWQFPYISPALGIDQKWPYLILPLAFILMTVRLAQVYYQWIVHDTPLLHVLDEEVVQETIQ